MINFYTPKISLLNLLRDSDSVALNDPLGASQTKNKYTLPESESSHFQFQSDTLDLDSFELKDFFPAERTSIEQVDERSPEADSSDADQNLSLLQEKRFRVVMQGISGELSVAELCRREKITHDEFLLWSKEFRALRNDSFNDQSSIKSARAYERLIRNFSSSSHYNYFEHYLNFWSNRILLLKRSSELNQQESGSWDDIVCFEKLNEIRYINKHLELVNSNLPLGGLHIGCFETFHSRRERMRINRIPVLRTLYFGSEFFFKRMLPKIPLTKKLYFEITEGKDRLLSKAEGLGRLVSCGFKIMDYKTINGTLYYVVKKEKDPEFNMDVSYGPLFKMPRLGKNGEIILVYKLRTMHPYSEYLQDYIVRANGYASSGKPADDFRIPKWGKLFRRFWLDELPQLINVMKGEMKLVGIRPVSKSYFQDIPREMQRLRSTQKPGCIPPYVSLNRESNVMSVLRAEKDYLVDKIRHPYTTDIKYFFSALINIVFKNKRSA